MPEKQRVSVLDVLAHLKEGKRQYFLYNLNLSLVIAGIFALACFVESSLFVTIPLILIPWFYASCVMILDKQANDISGPSLFFSSYAMYFRPGPFGSYRLIRHFFIALGIALVALFFTSMIYVYVAPLFDPAFNDSMNELMTYLNLENLEAFQQFLSTNESIIRMMQVMSIVEAAAFFIVFVHKIALYGLNAINRTSVMVGDPNMNRLYGNTVRKNFKAFYSFYIRTLWPLFIIELGGGALGYYISGYIPFAYANQKAMFAIGFSLAFLSLVGFAYYVAVLDMFRIPFGVMMTNNVIQWGEKTLNDPMASQSMSPEEMEQVKKDLDAMKKALEEGKDPLKGDDDQDEPKKPE